MSRLPAIFSARTSNLGAAGSVERRARELEETFVRDDVKAILCARGGYGSNYLLPALDIKKIAAHPKIFIGYSDLTTLLTHFCDEAGMVTFHGPMVAKDFAKADGLDLASWQAALGGADNWGLDFGADSGVKPWYRDQPRVFCTAGVFRCWWLPWAHLMKFTRKAPYFLSRISPPNRFRLIAC